MQSLDFYDLFLTNHRERSAAYAPAGGGLTLPIWIDTASVVGTQDAKIIISYR